MKPAIRTHLRLKKLTSEGNTEAKCFLDFHFAAVTNITLGTGKASVHFAFSIVIEKHVK